MKALLADDSIELTGARSLERHDAFARAFADTAPHHGRVGVLLENSASKAQSILSVMAAGRVPVVLNPSDSQETLEAMIPRMGLHALMVSDSLFPELATACSVLRVSDEAQLTSVLAMPSDAASELPRAGTALILYTSGSMGEPKGVEISETGLLYTVDFLVPYFGLSAETIAPVLLPICHSMAMNTQFLPTFLIGGKCVFFQTAYSLNKVYRNLLASQGDFVAMIGEILRLCWEERRKRDLPPAEHVRHVQLAGGIVRSEHLEMARELFPNAVIHKGYGLTEGIRVSMINSDDPNFFTDNAGYVLPEQEIEVRTSTGRKLPPGSLGHIYLRGPNVMLGYDRMPEWPKGLRAKDGFMKTGDMGVLTVDRRLIIHGRSDSIFKVQGKRVSAKEIEKVALASSKLVRDVKVLPVEDAKVGARPVLFLEIAAEKERTFLHEHKVEFERKLRDQLAHKNSLPRDVFILHHFPRTYNGKLRAQVLSQVWADREKIDQVPAGQGGVSFRVAGPSTLRTMH